MSSAPISVIHRAHVLVETQVATIESAFQEFTERKDIAILLINQHVSSVIPQITLKHLTARSFPMRFRSPRRFDLQSTNTLRHSQLSLRFRARTIHMVRPAIVLPLLCKACSNVTGRSIERLNTEASAEAVRRLILCGIICRRGMHVLNTIYAKAIVLRYRHHSCTGWCCLHIPRS